MKSNWYKKAQKAKPYTTDEWIKDTDKPKWTSVDSSFISATAYYEPTGMLEVKMKNGNEYSFAGVPKGVFDSFMKSESKGKFFNEVIKKKY